MPSPIFSSSGWRRFAQAAATGSAAILCVAAFCGLQLRAQTNGRTRCDSLIPLKIEMIPVSEAVPGGTAQFQVDVQSGIDPDEVKSTHIEYEVPESLRRTLALSQNRDLPLRQGRAKTRFEIRIPDRRAYEIRARVVVELRNGGTVSQTAVRWLNVGPDYRPDGMIGRVVLPDGAGIRIYQGSTAR
jgi:hypothetical protein